MSDYQIVSRGSNAKALIDWQSAPTLYASVTRPVLTNAATEARVQVVPGCDSTAFQLLLNQWNVSNPFPLYLMPGGSARAMYDMNPNWPVQISVTSNGNTLTMNDWHSALQLAGWNLVNSAQTKVRINAQP